MCFFSVFELEGFILCTEVLFLNLFLRLSENKRKKKL